MAAVLTKLVKKTANWTVDKLRDELLVLNKLVYPFRTRFDRTKLMMVRKRESFNCFDDDGMSKKLPASAC